MLTNFITPSKCKQMVVAAGFFKKQTLDLYLNVFSFWTLLLHLFSLLLPVTRVIKAMFLDIRSIVRFSQPLHV
jgi:hypothetical protein